MNQEKVCIVGSGNWGCAIAKIIGENIATNERFNKQADMWVYEELIHGKKLTEIINTTHENPKYLPGVTLPDTIHAEPDLLKACSDATILVFVLPHQFLPRLLAQMKGRLRTDVKAISLIKGVHIDEDNKMVLGSEMIESQLQIDVAVLSGANVAAEVAKEEFCETTIGSKNHGEVFKELFTTGYFRVRVVPDVKTVEMCGGLKNIVALGAGFSDGLNKGGNTKAAIIRIGLQEMKLFCSTYLENPMVETFFESCGVADLITTCCGGRNRRVAEAFVKTGKTFEELEKEMLDGQKLQGTLTCQAVIMLLKHDNILDKFPLFSVIHEIAFEGAPATKMFD